MKGYKKCQQVADQFEISVLQRPVEEIGHQLGDQILAAAILQQPAEELNMTAIDWSFDTLIRCRKFYQSYQDANIVATPLQQLETNKEHVVNEHVTDCGNNVAQIHQPRFTMD